MQITVPYCALLSSREVVAEHIPMDRRDRNDKYRYRAQTGNPMTREVVIYYECEEVNSNPDFDW